jgi:hypothetical protein
MRLAVNRFHPGISHWIWMPLATQSAAMEGRVMGFKPVAIVPNRSSKKTNKTK